MSSLLVTLIAILLVAALLLAVVYFGGSAFTDGGAKAEVARLMNEGSQITAAAVAYHVNQGDYAADISALTSTSYLTAAPSASWQTYKDTAVLTNVPTDQCTGLNAKYGITGIPLCTDPAVVGRTVCCQQTP